MEILTKIVSVLVTPLIAFGGFVHDIVAPTVYAPVVQYVPEYIEIPQQAPTAGAIVPSAVALFSDSLKNSISSSDTSFELVRGTDKTGTALASSTYGFIIDEGEANEEMVLANCTGTVCTNVTRGINPVSGTSTTASLQKSHRRGASVKITDGPILITLSQIARGREGFGAIVKYDTSIVAGSFTDSSQIVNKSYVDSVAFSGAGVIDATNAAKGVAELATNAEVANGTAVGSSGNLVIPSSLASSTRVAGAGVGIVVVTDSTGMIDDEFLPRTISTTTNFVGTTTFTGKVQGGIDKAYLIASSTFTGASTPQASYITASGTATSSRASATSTNDFSGFVINTVSVGGVAIMQTSGVVSGFSGLATGTRYYVQNDGTIGATPGTNGVLAGIGISGTELFIQKEPRKAIGMTTIVDTGTAAETFTDARVIGFRPKSITFSITNTAGAGATPYFEGVWTEGGTAYFGRYYDGATVRTSAQDITDNNTIMSFTDDGAATYTGSVSSVTNTGFTLSFVESGDTDTGTFYVLWKAEGY